MLFCCFFCCLFCFLKYLLASGGSYCVSLLSGWFKWKVIFSVIRVISSVLSNASLLARELLLLPASFKSLDFMVYIPGFEK